MVTITDKTLCISISSHFPAETLLDLQKGIITALKEQCLHHGNENEVTVEAETLSGNYALLSLLEILIEPQQQIRG